MRSHAADYPLWIILQKIVCFLQQVHVFIQLLQNLLALGLLSRSSLATSLALIALLAFLTLVSALARVPAHH